MTKKSTIIDLSNLTLDMKQYLYSLCFSSHTNTAQSFEHKVELYTLLSFMTFQLMKRQPEIFHNTYDVLNKYIFNGIDETETGTRDYLIGLSIVCDDLIWGVNDVPPPTRYNNSAAVRDRIRELISEWMPF